MASRPKEQRLVTVLKRLAVGQLGEGAEPIDLVVHRVASGQTITAFAKDVAAAMGEDASRAWISWICNRLTPDAKARIAAARKEAAMVLAEEAPVVPVSREHLVEVLTPSAPPAEAPSPADPPRHVARAENREPAP